MIREGNPGQNLTLDEMLDCLRGPKNKRSLAELDDVIDDIIDRNPEWVQHIMDIVEGRKNEQTD